MPLISIETNQSLTNTTSLKQISAAIANLLGKPENYVMLKYEHNDNMLYAGNNQPLAHIKLKSLGLDEEQTKRYSSEICKLIAEQFDVPRVRVYIEFSNPERHLWGWSATTFWVKKHEWIWI